jgi:glycosyltransferase involved in cell wall biosynthesis
MATVGGWLERWGERRAAATLVLTAGLAERVAHTVGREHVHVVRRPVERDAFADPGPDPFPHLPRRSRIVFVGRLSPQKGVATLLAAFAGLTTPGARLVLVGDGPDRDDLERQARRLGVRDRIHVTGFVPHSRIPAVLASADLLVLPSVYEEFGTVLVEAMQVGLPAVASRVGGIPEVVEDGVTGLLVPPGDPRSLAAAIDRVLGDPELAQRLGGSARRRAPDYDADRVGTEIRHLYARLIDDHRTRGRGDLRSRAAAAAT